MKLALKKNFFLKIIIPMVAAIMLVNAIIGIAKNPKRKSLPPQESVVTSTYKSSISGLGIVEPKNEAIEIGVDVSGVVSQVYVNVGDKVKKDDKLFTVDDRAARANINLKQANYEAAKLDAAEKRSEFEMYRKISDKRAYSQNEFNKKRVASEVATQNIKQAKAELEMAEITLDKLTVKSPIDAEVLKVNIQNGEFAQSGLNLNPAMIIGDLSVLHVRVEIEESRAHLISKDKPAIGYLRGNPNVKVPLTFVRIEPKIVPKISISGANAEKIDSRVLQVIYSFDGSLNLGILVGQQMDVYIENNPT